MDCGGGAAAGPAPDEPSRLDSPPATTEGSEATAATGSDAPTEPDGSEGNSTPAELTGAPTEPLLAERSAPPGLKPLTEAEEQELKGSCAKLVTWAQKRAGQAPTRASATQKLLDALTSAPKIEGVDVPRCRALLTRSLEVYVARTQEVEAITALKILMMGMASAVEQRGKLCPSAPPVPTSLTAVKATLYQPSPKDWQAEGWRCLGHHGSQAQSFQYEVKSDPAAGTFEIAARGYPATGSRPTELFLTSEVVNGKVELHSNVYRRCPSEAGLRPRCPLAMATLSARTACILPATHASRG